MKLLSKIFATVTFVCILIFDSSAQTNVSGFISTNTTWNLGGSPYIVKGNALVSNNVTLTIDPGVVVKFDTNKALQIDGELIAIGTPQNRITFTSNQTSPAPGDWAKIHFADTCKNAVFDSYGNYLSGSIMKFCDVLYGGSLGFGEIHIENSSPFISECKIKYSSSNGIYCDASGFNILRSTIESCVKYGIFFEDLSYSTIDIQILEDTLRQNLGGIMFNLQNNYNKIFIRDNYFISNSPHGAIDNNQFSASNINILNNRFLNNTGTFVVGFDQIISDTIDCNRFVGNSVFRGCIWTSSFSDGVVRNNVFDSNTSNYTPVITFKPSNNGFFYFTNNFMINNTGTNSTCYFEIYYYNNSQLVHVDYNCFINNNTSNTVYLTSQNAINANQNWAYFKHNTFSDPLNQYELYNDIPYGSPNVYVDSNYWGGTSSQHIDSVIYDYFDYANQSVVYYSPFLLNGYECDTSCSLLPTDVHSVFENLSFSVFPNPSNGKFTVTFAQLEKRVTVQLFTLEGRMIYMHSYSNVDRALISVDDLTAGIYFLRIDDGDRRGFRKIIVE